jgi:hypothetical protein
MSALLLLFRMIVFSNIPTSPKLLLLVLVDKVRLPLY